ncbi:prephenate dehydratase [Candidatus Peregrinibacteria bacterium]|nr:prephenate dehydratase [Candidatus Peregrinibacteria bacterium]
METRIIHHGIPGSFSHSAAVKIFGQNNTFISAENFNDVFAAVSKNKADFGVVPIENSLAGSIYENYDYLSKCNLRIAAEHQLKIEHHLIGLLKQRITHIFSHQKAFEQCREFLKKLPHVTTMICSDTAAAVKHVSEQRNIHFAAIAGMEAAKLYNLLVLKKNIEDNPRNFTRFLVISNHQKSVKNADKCSITFALKHQPGSLHNALKIFAENNLNLTKIESRPIHGKPFEYIFYIDFEFNSKSLPKVRRILNVLKKQSERLKILGFYKKHHHASSQKNHR